MFYLYIASSIVVMKRNERCRVCWFLLDWVEKREDGKKWRMMKRERRCENKMGFKNESRLQLLTGVGCQQPEGFQEHSREDLLVCRTSREVER